MIYTNQTVLVPWLVNRLKIAHTDGIRVLGRLDPRTGDILGAVGYDWWTGLACEVHMAGVGPGWATPEFLWAGFDYPFNQCGCEVLLARVTDPQVVELDKRLGFKTDFILDGAHPDGALHYMSMRRAECRWLNRRHHGKQSTGSTSAP